MDIQEIIVETLEKAVSLPVYYIHAIQQTGDYIIYNYIEMPSWFSNNEEEINYFNVSVNLVQSGDFTENKKKIEKTMKENGFVRQSYGIATYDERANKYTLPMVFEKILENEERKV